MDLLKEELLKKRQSLAQETGGRRVFKRSEIEQKQIQKLREQEKRELEAKSRRQSNASSSAANDASAKSNPSASIQVSLLAFLNTSHPIHYFEIFAISTFNIAARGRYLEEKNMKMESSNTKSC
ncbi:hypothetical protein PVK06_028807 [Gossypium arboreum]|uniref:Uncharacterized protein n=1 Tax=Gossypium arboreum TaxID=29729 RepID=A0ABR0P4V0_GOSAR|nr:hypothetical protein PVK06_028807 [Gossypium arboreum]